jgi:hypothetical protein
MGAWCAILAPGCEWIYHSTRSLQGKKEALCAGGSEERRLVHQSSTNNQLHQRHRAPALCVRVWLPNTEHIFLNVLAHQHG